MANERESTKGKSNGALARPRGTQDILPGEQKYWEHVIDTAVSVFRGWNFQRIDTPIFEEVGLFERGIGEETDVVSKELFLLKPRGGSVYALRPEGTAPVARAYIENGMRSRPQPVKMFYVGPFFRYDRPQKGRWRQLHQFGVEVIGSPSPVIDAQLLFLSHLVLQTIGVEDYVLQVNSIGEPKERSEYIKLLKEHYRRHNTKMCRDCKERIVKNPLRVLDCKEEKCQQLKNTAPRLMDHLSDASRAHFDTVVKMLDGVGVVYEVNPLLVRGLDYYSHTVWEFVSKREGNLSLSAGGRYDGLVKLLGGRATPAVGFSSGIERIVDQLKEEGVELMVTDAPQVFVAHLGLKAKKEALKIMAKLQQAQIPFSEALSRDGMQAQLRQADRQGVKWAIILGQKEVLDATVIFRNMESGMQEVVPQDKLVEELHRRLGFS